MDLCVFCDHPRAGHWGSGCHRSSFLRGDCDCSFVDQPALPAPATADQYRKSAAWWDERIHIIDGDIRRSRDGSTRRLRLERVRANAVAAARHAREMAEQADAEEARGHSGREPAIDATGSSHLDLITTEGLRRLSIVRREGRH